MFLFEGARKMKYSKRQRKIFAWRFGICVLLTNLVFGYLPARSEDKLSDKQIEELREYIESRRKTDFSKLKQKDLSNKRKRVLRRYYGSEKYVPKLDLVNPRKIGLVDVGGTTDSFSEPYCKVFQVTGKDEFLMSVHRNTVRFNGLVAESVAREEDLGNIWVKGVSTKGFTDGARLKLRGVFLATGSKTYQSAAGSRTVSMITKVTDLDRILGTEKESTETKKTDQKPKRSPTDPEKKAASKLRLAKLLLKKNKSKGKSWLQEIVKDFPETEAAKEAKDLLKKL